MHDLGLDAIEHLGEQTERFALERLLGILLRVTDQVDALAEKIHVGQMILPRVIDHGQHDVLFQLTHGLRANLLLLGAEHVIDAFQHVRKDALGINFRLLFEPVHQSQRQPERGSQIGVQTRNIPLFIDAVGGHMNKHH